MGLHFPVKIARVTTVLLVEDDADWRVLLERRLTEEGMRPIGLARGEWTTLAVETHHPDVVVLDLHLGGLDGLEVLELVRRRWPALPVIAMTAFGGRDARELARRRGATGFLEKPFPIAQLVSELTRATKGYNTGADPGRQSTGA